MPINYNTTLKNTRMTDVVTALGSGGKLKIYKADGTTLLAVLPLANPAGTVTGGVLTLSGVPITEASADASGVAAAATLTDASDTVIANGLTVSSSAGDLVLSSTNIVAGQPVTLTSGTITHG